MTSIEVKKDILRSTPIQRRHDSGYGGHDAFGYNLEMSPIRKKVVPYKCLININRSFGLENRSSKLFDDVNKVSRKLPFIIADYANNKTVSSSRSGDSGIESMCNTDDSKIEFNNSLGNPRSQSPYLNLKSFPTDLNSDILDKYINNKNIAHQPYKYVCKEDHQYSILGICSEILDKNNNTIKNVSHIKRKPFSTIDFLNELSLRNCASIVSLILSYLPDEELRKASNVCRDWRIIIFNDDKAYRRRLDYINNRRNVTRGPNKENRMQTKCQTERSHKSVFLAIMNVSGPSNKISKQPLYNDNLLGRFDSFCQEVKSLQEKEELMKCPKCNYPSKIKSGSKYCCTRNLCLYEFCKKCLGPYMDTYTWNHLCSEPKLNTSLPSIIGSKNSRKNLRRL